MRKKYRVSVTQGERLNEKEWTSEEAEALERDPEEHGVWRAQASQRRRLHDELGAALLPYSNAADSLLHDSNAADRLLPDGLTSSTQRQAASGGPPRL
jgi:hypothetical protein